MRRLDFFKIIKEDFNMAKKKKKGISTLSLVLVLIMIVGAALAFTGLFLDWTTTEVGSDLVEASSSSSDTLQDWADANDAAAKLDGEVKYFVVTNMFAWIAAAAVAAAAVLFVLKLLIRLKLLGVLGGVAGIVALVCGILAIVFTVLMGNEYVVDLGVLANSTTTPAIGCYLLTIGGVLGGGAAIGAAVKS